MNKWFRRTNRSDDYGTVGLLESTYMPDKRPEPHSMLLQPMVGAQEYPQLHDTLNRDRYRPFNTADTVVLAPVLPQSWSSQPDLSEIDACQMDPRIDEWLPKLDRWPALTGVPGPGDPMGTAGGSAPPPWPALGLPATPGPGLPGGSIGGLPYGGGMPCDAPLFGADAAFVEMPWRAAGGEAHPMTAPWSPATEPYPGAPQPAPEPGVPAAEHDATGPATQPASAGPIIMAAAEYPDAPEGEEGSDGQLPIFEQLLKETSADGQPAPPDVDWAALLNLPIPGAAPLAGKPAGVLPRAADSTGRRGYEEQQAPENGRPGRVPPLVEQVRRSAPGRPAHTTARRFAADGATEGTTPVH